MKSNSKSDIKYVMGIFILICLMLIFAMVNSFRVIDCCYFGIVLFFATRYMLLSRD